LSQKLPRLLACRPRRFKLTPPFLPVAAFYKDAAQQQQLERYITQLDAAGVLPGKIVTQVSPFTAFYAAEAEHQNYFERNPAAPYIVAYDQPRLARFKAWLPDFYREQAVLVDAAEGGATSREFNPNDLRDDLGFEFERPTASNEPARPMSVEEMRQFYRQLDAVEPKSA